MDEVSDKNTLQILLGMEIFKNLGAFTIATERNSLVIVQDDAARDPETYAREVLVDNGWRWYEGADSWEHPTTSH